MRRSRPQSHHRHPLTAVLGTGGNVRLLRVLAEHGGPLGTTRLADEARMSAVGARAALAALAAQGIVKILGTGHAQLYVLDDAHPFASPLKSLFFRERERWDDLLDALRAVFSSARDVKAAWLYGSAARGEDQPDSDLDVAVVMEATDTAAAADALRSEVQALEDRFGVSVSLVALSPGDILGKAENDAWWAGLVRDGLALKGVAPGRYASQLKRQAIAR